MKPIAVALLPLLLSISSTATAQRSLRYGTGHGGPRKGIKGLFRGGSPDELEFVDPGCTEGVDLVTCELPPRRGRHDSDEDDEGPVDGLYVCRDVKPKGRRGPSESDEEEDETIPASVCVQTNRTIEGDICGCCDGNCDPCTCGCDLTLKNGTLIEDAGVYLMVDDDNFQGQMCVPRVKAVTMIDMSQGATTCMPEPCV